MNTKTNENRTAYTQILCFKKNENRNTKLSLKNGFPIISVKMFYLQNDEFFDTLHYSCLHLE